MISGELPAYSSLNCLFDDIVSCSWCFFVQIQPRDPISQKSNLFLIDGLSDAPTDGPTDGRTHPPTEMRERI